MAGKILRWKDEDYIDAAKIIAEAEAGGTWIAAGDLSLPIEDFEIGIGSGTKGGLLISSSGTTARPRTCRLPFSMMNANARWAGQLLKLDESKEVIVSSSLHHTAGWNALLLPALKYGASILIRPNFDAFEIVRLMSESRSRVFHLSPLQAMLVTKTKGWKNLVARDGTTIVLGSSDVPPRLIQWYVEKGFDVVRNYGLTEAGPYIFSQISNPSNVNRQNLMTIGDLAPTVEHKLSLIASTNLHSLWLRGEAMFEGYDLDNHRGWFETGDLFLVQEGQLNFACRYVDLVKHDEIVVTPNLVERLILESNHNIADVLVTPDSSRSELALNVSVVGKLTGIELNAIQRRASDLTRIPTKLIQIVRVTKLVRTKSGKLVRARGPMP